MVAIIGHSELASFAVDKVNLPGDRVSRYRHQVNALRDRLESKIKDDPNFDLVKMLHSGSVAKGTALSTINDLDVAVYVRSASAPEFEPDLLNWLADRLREATPQMNHDQFSVGTHCVKVNFRGSGLDVDVVPVLYEGADDDYGYLLNHENGEWVETSIPLHLDFIRNRKKKIPTHFSQMVRLVKWWANLQKANRQGFRFKSFMAELVCSYLADKGYDFTDYSKTLESIFAYVVKTELKESIVFKDYHPLPANSGRNGAAIEILDPVNPMNNVAERYSDVDRGLIVEAANDAFDAITEASRSDTKGRAVDRWKEVLGPSFRA